MLMDSNSVPDDPQGTFLKSPRASNQLQAEKRFLSNSLQSLGPSYRCPENKQAISNPKDPFSGGRFEEADLTGADFQAPKFTKQTGCSVQDPKVTTTAPSKLASILRT